MSQIGIALTAIMMLLLVAFMAPNIMAINRGKVLRNIAIWLAIFTALGYAYKVFGPGHAPFSSLMPTHAVPQEQASPPSPNKNDGNDGFTPPKEE